MMFHRWLMAERYDARVGACFDTEEAARDAANVVRARTRLPPDNVEVITPGDAGIDRKLEPELEAIADTLVRTHLLFGAAGLLFGLALAGLLLVYGLQPFLSNPGLSLVLIPALGAVLGLFLGGLAGLPPNHDPVVFAARSAADAGACYVVVRARAPAERQAARRILGRRGTRLRATLL